jgi:hypothetical protein
VGFIQDASSNQRPNHSSGRALCYCCQCAAHGWPCTVFGPAHRGSSASMDGGSHVRRFSISHRAPLRAWPLSTAARRTPPSAAGTPGTRMRRPPGGPVPGCRSWTAAGPASRSPGMSRSCSAAAGPVPARSRQVPGHGHRRVVSLDPQPQASRKGIGQGDALPV